MANYRIPVRVAVLNARLKAAKERAGRGAEFVRAPASVSPSTLKRMNKLDQRVDQLCLHVGDVELAAKDTLQWHQRQEGRIAELEKDIAHQRTYSLGLERRIRALEPTNRDAVFEGTPADPAAAMSDSTSSLSHFHVTHEAAREIERVLKLLADADRTLRILRTAGR